MADLKELGTLIVVVGKAVRFRVSQYQYFFEEMNLWIEKSPQ
jgi:hypothetical protein